MTLEFADASILKQGAHIVIPNAEQAAGGGDTLTAALIAVGKDGTPRRCSQSARSSRPRNVSHGGNHGRHSHRND